jgi:acetyl-CoA carboxylase carboxyltransferase component
MTRPAPDKMLPYEWLYWAMLDAGMEREAEGMKSALMSFREAMADAAWQAEQRAKAEAIERERIAAWLDQDWDEDDQGERRHRKHIAAMLRQNVA